MRLCFFAPPLTYRGGVGNLSVNMIKHLARYREIDEIFVVCDGVTEEAYRSLKHRKLSIHCLGRAKRSDFMRVMMRNFRYVCLHDRIQSFDVFHVLDERVFPMWNPNLQPLVITIHNVMLLEFIKVLKAVGTIGIESVLGDIDLYLPQIPLEFLSAKKAQRIVVNSPIIAKRLEKLYHNIVDGKIKIIPPGFDPTRFNPYHLSKSDAKRFLELDSSSKLVLHVGGASRQRSGERKGLPYLLYALEHMHKTGDLDRLNILLLVIGEVGKKCKRLLGRAIEKRVIELRSLGQDVMPRVYRAADVLVMPSISEGWGMAAIEALACGTPIVASQNVPSALATRDTGVVHIENQINNPQRLATSILNVLETEPFRAVDWDKIFNFLVSNYSWANLSKSQLRIYEELVNRREPN